MERMAHVGVVDMGGWEGKPIEVEVYTKQPEVRLYLNDQLVGTKQVSRQSQFKAVFTIGYQPGILRAEALSGTGGSPTASVALRTAGEPARLRLTADRRTIAADGQDLAFVAIEVVDRQGNVCPDAAIPCEVTVGGQGQLLVAASADLKDTEPYTSPRVTTWNGRAIIVVRSSQKAGKAKVSVKSSLPTATATIAAKARSQE